MSKTNQFDNPENSFLLSLLPVLEKLSTQASWPLINESFKSIQDVLTTVLTSSNRISLDSLMESLSIMQGYMESISQIYIDTLSVWPSIQETLLGHVVAALEMAFPYMDSAQREEYQEEVVPKLEKVSSRNKLTISDILAIISLLVTIYFGIVSSLPNEQLDRISQQNEIIIGQQAELIELTKEDTELRKTLDALTDSINLLSDEVESLRNEIENADEVPELNGHSDAENGQEQNSDSQE